MPAPPLVADSLGALPVGVGVVRVDSVEVDSILVVEVDSMVEDSVRVEEIPTELGVTEPVDGTREAVKIGVVPTSVEAVGVMTTTEDCLQAR